MNKDDTLTLDPSDAPPAPDIQPELPSAIEPSKDSAPKRGRGRPKGSTNKTTTQSRTPVQTSANRSRPSRAAKTAVIDAVIGLVEAVNIAVSMSPYKDDCLTPDESAMLSKAVALEIQESDRVSSWLTRAGSISAHIVLLQAVVMIAVPRLQRRGILPRRELTPEQMEQLRAILEQTAGETARESFAAAAPTV